MAQPSCSFKNAIPVKPRSKDDITKTCGKEFMYCRRICLAQRAMNSVTNNGTIYDEDLDSKT